MRAELRNPNFRLNFNEGQLPFDLEWQAYLQTGIELFLTIGFGMAYMILSETLVSQLMHEKSQKIKH